MEFEEPNDDRMDETYPDQDENSEVFIFTPKYIAAKGTKTSGPILRFTELFGPTNPPNIEDVYLIKAKKLSSDEPLEKAHVNLEYQNPPEQDFDNYICYFVEKKPEPIPQDGEDITDVTQTKIETKTDQNDPNVKARTEFGPVDLIPWEDKIIWDNGDFPPKSKKLIPVKKLVAGEGKKIELRRENREHWGSILKEVEVEDEKKQPVIQFQPPTVMTNMNNFASRLPTPFQFNTSPMVMSPKMRINPIGSPQFPIGPSFPTTGPGNKQVGPSVFGFSQNPIMKQPTPAPIVIPPPPVPPAPPKEVPKPEPPKEAPKPPGKGEKKEPKYDENGKKIKRKYTRRKKPDGTEVEVEVDESDEKMEIRHVLGKVLNQALLNGDWEDQIIWDDVQGPNKPVNTKLILDMNDRYMIFEKPRVEPTVVEGQNLFNLSNDKEYEMALTSRQFLSQKKGRHIVKHSLPALYLHGSIFRTYLSHEELRRLHRNRLAFHINHPLTIGYKPPKKEKPYRRSPKAMNKLEDLQAHNHRVVLLEYVEQNPPVLNNVGMATKIVNYFKKKEGEDSNHRVDDGIPQIIDESETVPLIGKLHEGKPFVTTENTLFSAQIFKQDVNPTDFLVTTVPGSSSTQFLIRELPAIYTVGHTQPHQEVFAPNSKQAINFAKNRLMLYMCRELYKNPNGGLKMDDIRSTFPGMSEGSIRKRLAEVANFGRGGEDSGYWTKRPDFVLPSQESLMDLVTPEMVCMNDAMEAASFRHEEFGITTDATMASYAILSREGNSSKYKNTVKFIENERMNAPWNKTSNFINSIEGREGANIELLPVAKQVLTPSELDKYSSEAKKILEDSEKKTHIQMTHQEAEQVLLESGQFNEEKLKGMKRSEKKAAARKLLEQLGQGGRKSALKEKVKTDKIKEIMLEIYDKEAKKLETSDPYYESEDEMNFSEEEDFDLEKDLEKSDDEVKRKHYVKKTVTITHPDGRKEDKVEIIRDPVLVEVLRKRQEMMAKASGQTKKEKKNEQGELIKAGQKDKRRLQDSFRRWKKDQVKDKDPHAPPGPIKERKKKEGMAPPRPKKQSDKPVKNIKCGTCGQVGHMSTNKMCPKYSEKKEDGKPLVEGGAKIVQEGEAGLKIKISTSLLAQMNESKLDAKQQKRRRKTTGDDLAAIFEEILIKIKNMPQAHHFLNPVDTSLSRDYKKIITKPIDLSVIERRNSNFQYTDIKPFLDDFELMVQNAHKYCEGKWDNIVADADVVLEAVKQEVEQVTEKIREIQLGPTTPMTPRTPTTNPKKKKKMDLLGSDLDTPNSLSGQELFTPGSDSSPRSALSQDAYLGSGEDTPSFEKQLNLQ